MVNSRFVSILITLTIVYSIGGLSIYFLDAYGWTLFLFLPVIIGSLPVYLESKKSRLTRSQAVNLGLTTLLVCCASLILFALEGLICIAMASPLLILISVVSSSLTYAIVNKRMLSDKQIIGILVITSVSFLSFDKSSTQAGIFPVKTETIINATPIEVWKNVIAFGNIKDPNELIFKIGIAYPTNATIKGTGVGAIRHCNFTTGSFVEPITAWEEPYLLAFDVLEQPAPLKELNPFWNISPPHLDGYFQSTNGQFRLEPYGENQTKIEGTTWYSLRYEPIFYWRIWTNLIIHKIHQRVLEHIKLESELS